MDEEMESIELKAGSKYHKEMVDTFLRIPALRHWRYGAWDKNSVEIPKSKLRHLDLRIILVPDYYPGDRSTKIGVTYRAEVKYKGESPTIVLGRYRKPMYDSLLEFIDEWIAFQNEPYYEK